MLVILAVLRAQMEFVNRSTILLIAYLEFSACQVSDTTLKYSNSILEHVITSRKLLIEALIDVRRVVVLARIEVEYRWNTRINATSGIIGLSGFQDNWQKWWPFEWYPSMSTLRLQTWLYAIQPLFMPKNPCESRGNSTLWHFSHNRSRKLLKNQSLSRKLTSASFRHFPPIKTPKYGAR